MTGELSSSYAGAFHSLRFAEESDGVLIITLSNPGRRNSMTREMHGDLANVWRMIDSDHDVRAVRVGIWACLSSANHLTPACHAVSRSGPQSSKLVPTVLGTKAAGKRAAIACCARQPVQCAGTSTEGSIAARSASTRGISGSNTGPFR